MFLKKLTHLLPNVILIIWDTYEWVWWHALILIPNVIWISIDTIKTLAIITLAESLHIIILLISILSNIAYDTLVGEII